jgi:hypothetical protein
MRDQRSEQIAQRFDKLLLKLIKTPPQSRAETTEKVRRAFYVNLKIPRKTDRFRLDRSWRCRIMQLARRTGPQITRHIAQQR